MIRERRFELAGRADLAYRCYAKLNLTLEVLHQRDDGYHELASLVHTIGLADELHVATANTLSLEVDGLNLSPEANLVTRAAELFFGTVHEPPGAELRLLKRIPAAAGLGGGSSDAASTLVGLNGLYGTRFSSSALRRLAATLGSDVPFFINGGAALMTGRGEHVQALPPLRGQWVTIVVLPHAVVDKTRRLYAALDPADFSSGIPTALAASQLQQGLPPGEEHLVNVFGQAARAIFPGLADMWTATERVCERRFFLSGAGPAIFAFAVDRADARRQHARLAQTGISALTARTVRHARAALKPRSPVPSGTLRGDLRARCLVVQW